MNIKDLKVGDILVDRTGFLLRVLFLQSSGYVLAESFDDEPFPVLIYPDSLQEYTLKAPEPKGGANCTKAEEIQGWRVWTYDNGENKTICRTCNSDLAMRIAKEYNAYIEYEAALTVEKV